MDTLQLLKRTYKTFPNDFTIKEWMDMCDKGEAFLFTQILEDKVVYAGVVEFWDDHLNARFGSGSDYKWNIKEIHDFLECMCFAAGVSKLQLTGRRGWIKKLKPLGFEIKEKFNCEDGGKPFYLYEKEFKKEEGGNV